MSEKKTGLILEGGAMRGMYTAGVIDVMMANGITFDGMVGVSAGAAFGCNYKSHQIGRVIRYNMLLSHDWRYCSIASWLLTGDLYGGKYDYHTLPERLDVMDRKTYDNNPMRFFAVCTDVDTGEPVYAECPYLDNQSLEYMRASASMPAASRPVKVDGRRLLDGGVSDPIPTEWMALQGYNRNVVVLTQPLDYVKKPQKDMKLLSFLLRDEPAILKKLSTRHVSYNERTALIRKQEEEGKLFVIRPKHALQIGSASHDPLKKQEVYRHGVEVMEERIEDLKKYLAD
ncbi:MAG: patatin family protein [Bulleidia sp.]|nr:patatin family protein [Bulleidia sp.]